MSVSDSCTFSRSAEERRSFNGKSFINGLYLWTAVIPQLRLFQRKGRGDPPRSVGSFKPVSAIKLTVAWKFSIISTSSLLNSPLSPPSPLVAQLDVDLLRCRAGSETSLVSLVTTWTALIHELTCQWRELRNALSVRMQMLDGMWEMLGRWRCDWTFIQVSETPSSEEGTTHQLNAPLNNRMNNPIRLRNLQVLL